MMSAPAATRGGLFLCFLHAYPEKEKTAMASVFRIVSSIIPQSSSPVYVPVALPAPAPLSSPSASSTVSSTSAPAIPAATAAVTTAEEDAARQERLDLLGRQRRGRPGQIS